MEGGLVAVMRKVTSYVASIASKSNIRALVSPVGGRCLEDATVGDLQMNATGALIPPRLLRLSRYALPSLPIATTSWEGVAPGTSTSNGPELPRSCC